MAKTTMKAFEKSKTDKKMDKAGAKKAVIGLDGMHEESRRAGEKVGRVEG